MTEFSLVTVGVIELLELIVRKLAVLIITFLFITKKMTILYVAWSAFVLVVVVI